MNTISKSKRIMDIVFILSCLAMTFVLSLNYSVYIEYDQMNGYQGADYKVMLPFAAIALILMIPVYIYIARKKNLLGSVIQDSQRLPLTVYIIITLLLVLQIIFDVQKNYTHLLEAFGKVIHNEFMLDKGYKIFLLSLCLGSIVGIFTFVAFTGNLLIDFFSNFFSEADVFEKYYFVIASLACCSLICYVFSKTTATWNSLDHVYQTDTIFITNNYFPVFSFGFDFDWDIGCGGIRHPMATLLTFPIHMVCSFVANFLNFVPNILPMLYAFAQAELLILTAIVLKRITRSYWTTILYSFSFPFVFFTIFVEKYTLSVFMVVFFVYAVLRQKSLASQKYFLIAGSGMMITSAFYGFFYGNQKKIWPRLKGYISVGLTFLATMVATGRVHYLLSFGALLNQNHKMFFGGAEDAIAHTFFNKASGFSNMLASCFVPVEYYINEFGQFYWPNLTTHINWFGVAIFLFMIATIISNYRSKKVWIIAHWMLLAIIEWFIMGINVGADPLFSQYFSWAVMMLVVIGIKTFIKKPVYRLFIYIPLILIMFYTNLVHLKVMIDYISTTFPVV